MNDEREQNTAIMPARFCFVLVALAAGRSVNAEHYDAVGAARPRRRSRRSSSGIDAPKRASAKAQPLKCGLEPGSDCVPVDEGAEALVDEARERLREIKKRGVPTLDPLSVPPLIVYPPAAKFEWSSQEPQTLTAYLSKYRTDEWLGPVIRVYETFFAQRPTGSEGFVLEAGGLDGVIAGSNSYLFERFLGWNGLMVEANQLNFAKLLATRPGIFRAETALCPFAGNLSFTGPGGCCNSVAGKPAKHTGAGLRDGKWGDSHAEPRSSNEYKVRCTPIGPLLRAMRVPAVDLFSLDVESAEYAVLSGMDWSIPFSVLMIEGCKGSTPSLLRSKGFVRSRDAEPEKCRNSRPGCARDQVWYHPERIRPKALS